jgi:glycosyltransferase involved in cell wall biosynthesis/SAM-dependent methyltransferase
MESSLEPSINRGPATLVYDLQALREIPNAAPVMGGRRMRRSDMAWSLLNKYVGGREALQSRIPVRQMRKGARGIQFDFQTMELDLWGFAFYSSLRDLLEQKAERLERAGSPSRGRHLLTFSGEEIGQAVDLFRNHLARRLAAYELNFIRIMGLVSALKPLCQPAGDEEGAPWWIRRADFREDASTLRRFLAALESTFTASRLQEFKDRVSRVDAGAIEDFLGRLSHFVERHRASTPLPLVALARAAESHIRAVYGVGKLTCLGAGEEGVVFTDGRLAYKYFHYWKAGDRERRIAFLQSLAGRLSGYRTLPDLLEVSREGDKVVAVYPYEKGSPYQGGHLQDLLDLLREARQAGIACRNIHPDNLLFTASGIKLIDYGSDLVPVDDDETEQMCRRALLTYRFPFRSDLRRLLTESLANPRLPELTGLDQFRRALDARGLDELYYRPMAETVASDGPWSVLDYGCGDGRLTEELHSRGIRAVGYDPDPDLVQRRLVSPRGAAYGGRELLENLLSKETRFDTVVCGRVLCTIEDDSEFLAVLKDLRRLVSEAGTVLVAVCNPFHLSTQATELWERHLPEGYGYEDTFVYEKTVAVNGNRRKEVHRSYATYERAFSRAGFSIEGVTELEGTDVRNLLPASDHLVFRLAPLPLPVPVARVSLLVKTCHMEWRTIERQVRHLVGQLESPLQFVEKVIVVDPWDGPFARQYDRPDAAAHGEAMERLLSDGVIDRVVQAPSDPDIIRATYLNWFGTEAEESHSANGQQLFATLHGFDSCRGDYVLQVDSDLLIRRSDPDHDYLGEMVEVLRTDPGALFVPLSICSSERIPYTHEGPQGDWRVEARGCLFDRERLQSVLPVSNPVEQGRFALAWHRAFDHFVAATNYRSYRGGDPRTAFIHVPNERKADPDAWLDIMEAVERGHVPDAQFGSVELTGSPWEWAGPKRYEPVIFIICGRNVEPARFKRCVNSLVSQEGERWGTVVVDDASTNGFVDYALTLLADLRDRITLVRNDARRGGLFNTWNAVANFCGDPNSVIITLDADDALIGSEVLDRLAKEYEDGADVTVGSMLRLDKEASYPVNFERPRWWDSNVWQHLRTFRKRLFDAINIEDFKIDGKWIDLAADWAYMVPIIELASSPRHIPDPLYLYEPGEPKDERGRQEGDDVVARILARPRYPRRK